MQNKPRTLVSLLAIVLAVASYATATSFDEALLNKLKADIDSNANASAAVKTFVKEKLIPLCTNEVFAAQVANQNAKNVSLNQIKSIDEQSNGVEQINGAVSQMDQLTQSNASNAEESASSSAELKNQASELSQIIDELKAIVGSNSSGVIKTEQPAISSQIGEMRSSGPDLKEIPSASSDQEESEKVLKPEKVIPFDDKDLMNF